MYVSQPSLSISVRDLEKELGFKIFVGPVLGLLTRRGMEFYEKRRTLSKGLIFSKSIRQSRRREERILHF